ncbi:hypothetical protein K505DRAFT_144823 [Melanomma pulvis-pyrius CBS 109.77]|uniref:Ankyrin n=1 Tax=Melanomma pulvis-pyrius CBS 109.77 TaxID=1314802 RepID=A0A6A6XLC1_9PLEO|nr:hypothetical protein K505DRAFT_144823 [Melanomma pulvis-pyrius CBS 109.77]
MFSGAVVVLFLCFITDINVVHRALMWAAESGHSKVVNRILQHPGIDINVEIRGDTPLFSSQIYSWHTPD